MGSSETVAITNAHIFTWNWIKANSKEVSTFISKRCTQGRKIIRFWLPLVVILECHGDTFKLL